MSTVPNPDGLADRARRQAQQINAVIREWGAAADDSDWTVTLADGEDFHIHAGEQAVAELRRLGYQVGR